jgi:hypothetical protein
MPLQCDIEDKKRVGNRVVSIGEKPSYNPKGVSRRQAIGLKPSYGFTGSTAE